jgi:signal transduction histidine kinase
VRKHAKASRADVYLGEQDAGYLVTIKDDGAGFDIGQEADADTSAVRSAAMSERAEWAGGWFTVETTAGTGTEVEFWLPGTRAQGQPEV